MTETKQKGTELRTPKPKKKLGLSVPPALRLPHEELIVAPREMAPGAQNEAPVEATRPSQTSLTSQSSLTSPTSQTSQTSPTKSSITEAPVAPERDFMRVANSIGREAVRAGIFTGKSKQLYDCLYALTRGAVVPSRTVRISRTKLMEKANIGSRVTLEANLERLVQVGLVSVRRISGEHIGNEYTVFLPEEIGLRAPAEEQSDASESLPSQTSQSSQTSLTSPAQKLGRLVGLETSQTRQGSSPLESTTYATPNTFFNTHTDDDTHTQRALFEPLREAIRECVCVEMKNSEEELRRWRELGQLLADELRNAAQRATTISSVPAFLAAHLRRRLARPETETRPPKADEARPLERQETRVGARRTRDPEETTTAEGRRGSRFSLEECRRYAEHLRRTGQGIVNPGGFAMAIYRSGMADGLIAEFLEPEKKANEPDASQCPDCHGTGFYYPEGPEKGVVKCRHERLWAGQRSAAPLDRKEIVEQAEIIAELLRGGYTIERAEEQFGRSMSAEDWAEVRAEALRLAGEAS